MRELRPSIRAWPLRTPTFDWRLTVGAHALTLLPSALFHFRTGRIRTASQSQCRTSSSRPRRLTPASRRTTRLSTAGRSPAFFYRRPCGASRSPVARALRMALPARPSLAPVSPDSPNRGACSSPLVRPLSQTRQLTNQDPVQRVAPVCGQDGRLGRVRQVQVLRLLHLP